MHEDAVVCLLPPGLQHGLRCDCRVIAAICTSPGNERGGKLLVEQLSHTLDTKRSAVDVVRVLVGIKAEATVAAV